MIQKTHRQLATCTIHPPRNGATAPAMPPSPDHAPIARPRSAAPNDDWMIASAPGVSSAPPTPWRARAAMSARTSGASPHSRDASANQMTPTRNTRRLPSRSPSDPPSSKNAARVSPYPLTVHWSAAVPACSSRPISGSAIVTTVPSMNASADPSTVANRTQRPCAVP